MGLFWPRHLVGKGKGHFTPGCFTNGWSTTRTPLLAFQSTFI